MKRTFLILLPGLVATAAAAPALLGLQLERSYRAAVEQMRNDGLRVVRSEYQRGWLNSAAETDLLLAAPAGDAQWPDKELVLTLRNSVDHGPLVEDGSVLMGRMQTRLLADGEPLYPPPHPAVVNTRLSLLGPNTTIALDLPARVIAEAGDRPGIEFAGLAGELRFGETRDSVAGELGLAGLTLVKGGQPVIRLRGVTANWQMRRGAGGLLFGDAGLGLEDVLIVDPVTGTRISLQGFAVASASSVLDGNVEMRLEYTLARALIGDLDYGPADIGIRLGNLSAQVLGKIREALGQTKARNLGEAQRSIAVLGVLTTNVPQLLRNDPSFTIEHLHLETPDGAVDGSLSVQAKGMVWPTSDWAETLRKLHAEVSLRLPDPVFRALLAPGVRQRLAAAREARRLAGNAEEDPAAEQRDQEVQRLIEQQLADIVDQGILLRNDQGLTLSAALREGRLEVNGRDFPLPLSR